MNVRNTQLLEQRYSAHPLKSDIARALTAAERFRERAAAIRENKHLSAEGQAVELRAQLKSVLRDIRDAAEPIAEMRARLADIQASIRKPVFDKTDVVAALARQEIRAALRGMSLTDKAALRSAVS
jgi:chromosome segregation ATPase